MRRLLRLALLVVALVSGLAPVLVAGAVPAGAQQGEISRGPALTTDTPAAEDGSRVQVTFADWEADSAVVTVCGNLALRGSADCNMAQGTGVRLRKANETPTHTVVVAAPPTPCPCVIRATSSETGEVAFAGIAVFGHPVADVVPPDLGQPLAAVTVDAEPAADGVLGEVRRSLGGGSPHDAVVTVRNLVAQPLTAVHLHGRARRGGDTVAEFDLDPGPIGPGETWRATVPVELPAPAVGDYEWEVAASGAGPVVVATSSTRAVPLLLVVLSAALVGLLVAVLVRGVQRRRRPSALPIAGTIDPEAVIDVRDRAPSAAPPSGARPPGAAVPERVREPTGAGV